MAVKKVVANGIEGFGGLIGHAAIGDAATSLTVEPDGLDQVRGPENSPRGAMEGREYCSHEQY
ncbi:MAG: hypothetical protein AAGD06_07385 [Acidobacteriota bacterium]